MLSQKHKNVTNKKRKRSNLEIKNNFISFKIVLYLNENIWKSKHIIVPSRYCENFQHKNIFPKDVQLLKQTINCIRLQIKSNKSELYNHTIEPRSNACRCSGIFRSEYDQYKARLFESSIKSLFDKIN